MMISVFLSSWSHTVNCMKKVIGFSCHTNFVYLFSIYLSKLWFVYLCICVKVCNCVHPPHLALSVQGGWTSLHLASEKGHLEVVKLLLDRDASLEAQDEVVENWFCVLRRAVRFVVSVCGVYPLFSRCCLGGGSGESWGPGV